MLWIYSCYSYSLISKLMPWFDYTTAFLGKKRCLKIQHVLHSTHTWYKKYFIQRKRKSKPSVFWLRVAQISEYSLFRASDEFTIFTNTKLEQRQKKKCVCDNGSFQPMRSNLQTKPEQKREQKMLIYRDEVSLGVTCRPLLTWKRVSSDIPYCSNGSCEDKMSKTSKQTPQ